MSTVVVEETTRADWLETPVPPWETHLLFRVPDGQLDAAEHMLRGKRAAALPVGEHVHLTDVDTDHPIETHWRYARVVEVGNGWARGQTVKGLTD